MTPTKNATAEEGRPDPLAELGAKVREAIAFAEEVPEPYRARVFDLAYERLSGRTAAAASFSGAPASSENAVEVMPIATGGLALLAKELGVEQPALARVVAIGEDSRLSIAGRVKGRTNAEMQVEFTAVYLLVTEKLFNRLDVPADELRELCRSKSCYNKDHFADYYAKSDLVSPVGERGSRGYRLTKKGVEVAKDLLRKMVEA